MTAGPPPHPALAGGPVYVTRYDPGRLRLERVGQLMQSGLPPLHYQARFGDWAYLESAGGQLDGAQLTMRLAWHASAAARKRRESDDQLTRGGSRGLGGSQSIAQGARYHPHCAAEAEQQNRPSGTSGTASFAFVILLIAIWFVLFVRRSQRSGNATRRSAPFWFPIGGSRDRGGWPSGGG